MLGRGAVHAIKALLEMARDPSRWRSVRDLATAQDLPAPMLEQLLMRLRRAGLLEAGGGRAGGYRLRRPAAQIPLAAVLAAVGADPAGGPPGVARSLHTGEGDGRERSGDGVDPSPEVGAGDRVTEALRRRLRRAVERELAQLTLEELLFDLRSARASMSEEGGLLLG